jgi:SHS2 domain-containing protein
VPFEFLDHTGDTAVQLSAADERQLFREAARALTAIIVDTEQGSVEERESRPLELDAEDGESLLVDFLNELIFLFDRDGFLCAGVAVEDVVLEAPARLKAVLRGERYDSGRHRFLTEVKAATFHGVGLERGPAGLRTMLVFDL